MNLRLKIVWLRHHWTSLSVSDRLFAGLFACFTLLALLPLWSVRIPPMQDMWQHLALVDVIHNYEAPGSVYPEYFVLPSTPKPNLVYYYLTHLLAYMVPLEVANKLVLTLYIVFFPLSFLYLLCSFGRSRWLSLFVFPFVYNAMFGYGFVSFLLGMPMLFFAVGAFRRFVAPRGYELDFRTGVLASILIIMTFFTHAHIYMLTMFLVGLLLLIHREGFWGTALRAAPMLPSLAFFVPWFIVFFVEQTPATSGIRFGSLKEFFGPTYYKPSMVMSNAFRYISDYFRDESDDALFLVVMCVAFVLLALRRSPRVTDETPRKIALFDLELLSVLLAISVLALPHHIEAQAIVSLRHIIFALLFFFGWLGVEDAPRQIVIPAFVVLCLANIANTANLMRGFRLFQEELDNYPALFKDADGGARMFKTTYNQESRYVNYGALWHMHFFYTLEKGGISDMQFAEYPHNPIQYRADMIPPMLPVEFYRSPVWKYYEYILLRKSSMPSLKPVQAELEEVSDVSDWVLYRVLRSPGLRPVDDAAIAIPRRLTINYGKESLVLTGDQHVEILRSVISDHARVMRGVNLTPSGVRPNINIRHRYRKPEP